MLPHDQGECLPVPFIAGPTKHDVHCPTTACINLYFFENFVITFWWTNFYFLLQVLSMHPYFLLHYLPGLFIEARKISSSSYLLFSFSKCPIVLIHCNDSWLFSFIFLLWSSSCSEILLLFVLVRYPILDCQALYSVFLAVSNSVIRSLFAETSSSTTLSTTLFATSTVCLSSILFNPLFTHAFHCSYFPSNNRRNNPVSFCDIYYFCQFQLAPSYIHQISPSRNRSNNNPV